MLIPKLTATVPPLVAALFFLAFSANAGAEETGSSFPAATPPASLPPRAAPRNTQEALKLEAEIRRRLRSGDEMAVREALRHLRWKYPKRRGDFSGAMLTRSREFGAATRTFVHQKLAAVQKRLRAGDRAAWQEAHRLAQFVNASRFERSSAANWRWLGRNLRGAAREFVRREAARLLAKVGANDAESLRQAQALVRLQRRLEGNLQPIAGPRLAAERLRSLLEGLAKGHSLRAWQRILNERRRRAEVRRRRLEGERRHRRLMRTVRERNRRIEKHLARRRTHLRKAPPTNEAKPVVPPR